MKEYKIILYKLGLPDAQDGMNEMAKESWQVVSASQWDASFGSQQIMVTYSKEKEE